MPWPGQPASSLPAPNGPALFLYPTNDSFIPKMISLVPSGNRVKIGRQTNNRTVPGERNGYFDSKVLSRQHAEVWEENGKIYIKDVRSSNGTFVNGERLSVESMESEPWELKTDDRVEFGIDIVGEDNKTIIHHKVAATVFCVITADDFAQLNMHHPTSQQHHSQHPNGSYLQVAQQRRPSLQQAQSPVGLGGLGGGPTLGLSGRAGKSGLTFDHILSRLQSELQKSRETGSDLNSLASVMTDINENLVGGAHPPAHNPLVPLPPVRPQIAPPPASPAPQSVSVTSPQDNVNFSALQTQLQQTQSALANHADKVKTFEGVIAEHELVKREVQAMRDLMEQRKLEMESLIHSTRLRSPEADSDAAIHAQQSSEMLEANDDDSDARSVITIVPDDTSTDESLSENYHTSIPPRFEDDEEDQRSQNEAMNRPRTPEPHGLHDEDDEDFSSDDEAHPTIRHKHFTESDVTAPPNYPSVPYPSPSTPPQGSSLPLIALAETLNHTSNPLSHSETSIEEDLHSQNTFLSSRIETLTQQLDAVLSLSRTLQDSASAAHSTIEKLEAKVTSLEAFVQTSQTRQELEREGEESSVSRRSNAEASTFISVDQVGGGGTRNAVATLSEGTSTEELGSSLISQPHEPLTDALERSAPQRVEQPPIVLAELWEAWRTRIEGEWRIEREEWEAERLRLQAAVREWQGRMTDLESSQQQTFNDGQQLLVEMKREREEAAALWKKQQAQVQAQIQTHSDVMQSIQHLRNGAIRHDSGSLSSDDDDSGIKSKLLNGVNKKASRRQSSSGKGRKQRHPSQTVVTTPPTSPTLVNTEPSGSAAELSSAEESASPDLAIPGGIRRDDIFINGHVKQVSKAKSHIVPLSPAPSVRQDSVIGREGSSGASEPDSATLVNDDASSVGTGQAVFSTKFSANTSIGGKRRIHESPLPYISASVVFIGLAAWAFASRAKD